MASTEAEEGPPLNMVGPDSNQAAGTRFRGYSAAKSSSWPPHAQSPPFRLTEDTILATVDKAELFGVVSGSCLIS